MAASQIALDRKTLERRSKSRYPMEISVQYRTVSHEPGPVGIGRTVNVSSGGLLIAGESATVHAGTRLQVSLEWPSLLNGDIPLQLIAICRVARVQSAGFAVTMERYQFRTRKAGRGVAKAACSPDIA